MIPIDRLPLDTVRDIVRLILSVSTTVREHQARTRAMLEGLAGIVHANRVVYAAARKPACGGPPQWSSVFDIRRERHEPAAGDQWLCVHNPEVENQQIMFDALCRTPLSLIDRDGCGNGISGGISVPRNRPPPNGALNHAATKLKPHQSTAPAIGHSIGACRVHGQPAFSGRELAILQLFQTELARPNLAGAGLHVLEKLPPRLQRVLPLLLQGAGIKEIAQILDLSRFTVQEYVQDIYQHFEVSTRRELQALLARQPAAEP
jgi:DNA-binding CsgD family transcriptional regulator